MQHYILIKRMPKKARLSLGMIDDLAEEWEHQAAALRIRRERLLRRQERKKYIGISFDPRSQDHR